MTADLRPLAGLGALLEEERRLILACDYRALEPLFGRKAALIEAIGTLPGRSERKEMAHLTQMARRNQTLLAAAAEGLRAATRRLAELQNLHRGRGTYSAQGQRSDAVEGARIERRL